jgi:hypothetical protein
VPDWIDLAIMGLATWRLTSIVVNEAGPFDIFLRLRSMVGIEHDPDGKSLPSEGFWGLLSCVWCMSVWIAGFVYLIWWLSPVPVYIFAASTLCILVQSLLDRRQHG